MTDLRIRYRPGRFRHLAQWPDRVLRLITQSLAASCLPQAMLFQAGYGAGKTSSARLLGMRACCVQQDQHPYEPCGTCAGCQAVMRDPRAASAWGYSELDVQNLSPRETIDQLVQRVPYAKRGGKLMPERVVTLDEFHRLTAKDQEKSVKVIEDLASRWPVVFVLCAAEEASLCPAIVQRCSVRRLRLPEIGECARHLRIIARAEGRVLSPKNARLMAATANRSPRDYTGLLQDVILASGEDRIISDETTLRVCKAVR